jgi:hypothetical protein
MTEQKQIQPETDKLLGHYQALMKAATEGISFLRFSR